MIIWVRQMSMAAVLVALAVGTVSGAEQTFEVVERLNRTWRAQLVRQQVEAAAGVFHRDSARLSGPDGSIPVQLTDIETWGDTPFVKQAAAAFFVPQLLPLATNRYTLTFGPKAVGRTANAAVRLKARFSRYTITTDDIGIRLLRGSKTYRHAVPAADVPGPVRGLRMRDGRWTGGSQLYGTNSAITAYAAEIVEDGPVFVSARVVYTYSDSNTVTCLFRVVGGDHAVEVDTHATQNDRTMGWRWRLGDDDVTFPRATVLSGRHRYTREDELTAPFGTSLSAWTGDGWFRFAPMLLRLRSESPAGEVHLTSRDAGAWYESRPLAAIADFTRWKRGSMGWFWRGWRDTRLGIGADKAGLVTITSHNGKGTRRWTLSVDVDGTRQAETFAGKAGTAHTPHPRLDEVQAMILEWPDGEPRNPHLLLDAEELQAAAKREPKTIAALADLKALREQLDLLGEYDLMRLSLNAAGRYDVLINSPQLAPDERRLLRAQAAYLMYRLASPYNWSVERGYGSGNPNMSVSHSLNAGVMALALRDHPLSAQWVADADAVTKTDFWLEHVVDASGYWPESSHYARVSWANIVRFGILATRAGVRDYLGDPKYRAAALFYEQTLTPPDPSRPLNPERARDPDDRGLRVNVPYGRGMRFDAWGFGGMLARAYAERDPEFSRTMQWSWQQTGYTSQASHNLMGLETLYADRTLPTETPTWGNAHYPNLGTLLRGHVGARDDEHYLLLVSRYPRNADGEIWPADVGMIAKWFAYGVPLATAFPRVPETAHVLLQNRVLLACNWDPETKASPANDYQTKTKNDVLTQLPDVAYVAVDFDIVRNDPTGHNVGVPANTPAFPLRETIGVAPFAWRRQMLRVDDDRLGGRHYLVLRDTVSGGQPTQWHFWTLSEKMGEAAAATDREAFLADKPGNALAPLRPLTGNRFTAVGSFGVDLETYVAAPLATPRYTLRYGTQAGAYGVWGRAPTYQDLLHLQRSDDGSYFVALCPRRAGEAAPTFETQGDGHIIRVHAGEATDYLFLSEKPVEVAGDRVRFQGTAGTVRLSAERIALRVSAAGSVTVDDTWGLTADTAAALTVSGGDRVTVTTDRPADHGAQLTLRLAPGDWTPEAAAAGVVWRQEAQGQWLLQLPAGVSTVTLKP